ncbi:MAG: thiamine pyrophosphate-dependent enzyme [Planctomycetota bacterium]|jgi:2-oxoisovalerate dehydrogenase E1 component|nr:thiamine pyrophosphate-dependent enzyme [Planctomycetota bacterium]
MPKSQFVDPAKVRAAGSISFPEIPLCQYSKSLADERKRYSNEQLIGVYEDMRLIREFESMLHRVKMEGAYEGIEYNHAGPAHLSIGQEAAAVGQALNLTVDDHIFGSHRSHGEILAKGMSAIRKLSDDELLSIMKSFDGGSILKVVEQGHDGSVRDLAIDFLCYGALAEIFARATGFNKGMGGSMHAFFTPFGVYPNNAIVGGSADIATGSALFKKVNRQKGLTIANIGDASMGCGPVWEALSFAAMDQYRELWEESMRGGLPMVFNFFNNFYGMGGQTDGETMGYDVLARVGAGVNPEAMHAERVDGYNPLAVADAMLRKRAIIEEGRGPVLLETITYRISGHSPSDASSYRDKTEIEAWQAADPITEYAESLKDQGLMKAADLKKCEQRIVALMKKALTLAIDDSKSPRLPGEDIAGMMFSNRKVGKLADRPSEINDLSDNPRVKQIAKKTRSAFKDGKPVSKNRMYTYADAIFEAMLHRFKEDPTMVAYGEENRDWGGAFGCYRGLTEALPYHRLFNSPISEGAIVGTAVGYGLEGGRVVAELMYCDFMGRAGDEIFNQLAKWQSMSAGVLEMPVTLRVSVGNKYGAQHSQDWVALCAHMPGLKVAFPATPYDAKGMLNTALVGTDPTIFFESQRLYTIGEEFEAEVPEGYYEIAEGEPALRRKGKDLTIITVGATLYRAMEAAKQLEEQFGLSAEVWDARWLAPLNYEPLVESAKRTGRVVLASDACERGSFLHNMASTITQAAFGQLDAPPVVVGARNWITPGPEMEEDFFPQPSWIVDAIHENLLPLPGYSPVSNQTGAEKLRRARLGV